MEEIEGANERMDKVEARIRGVEIKSGRMSGGEGSFQVEGRWISND